MQIMVDDVPYAFAGAPGATVSQLASEVTASSAGRLIVRIRCNGQPVPDQMLDEVLAAPVGRYQLLELQTGQKSHLARSALAEARALFAQTLEERGTIADLLTEGQTAPAMERLRRLISTWNQTHQSMILAAEALQVDLDTLAVEGKQLPQILLELKHVLGELKQAMTSGDNVLVADMLRYDLEEPTHDWMGLLVRLEDHAARGDS